MSKRDYKNALVCMGLEVKSGRVNDYELFKVHTIPTHKRRLYLKDNLIKNNNLCAGCNILAKEDVIYSTKFNCCYDCSFSFWCEKYCFTFLENDEKLQCCGITFMKSFINENYNRGRFSLFEKSPEIITKIKENKYVKRYGINHSTIKGKSLSISDL